MADTLKQRLAVLEARMVALEAKQSAPEPDGPLATPTHLSYCGRQLWTVEGQTGLWCGKRDHDETNPVAMWVTVDGRRARGRSRRKFLYRLDLLTEQVAAIFTAKAGE